MAIIRRRKTIHGNPADSEKEPGGFPELTEPAGAAEEGEQEEELAERLTDSVLHDDGYSRRRPKRRKIRVELIKEAPSSGPGPGDDGPEPAGEASSAAAAASGAAAPADPSGGAGASEGASSPGGASPGAAASHAEAPAAGNPGTAAGAGAPAPAAGAPPAPGAAEGGHHRGRGGHPQNREKLLINDLSLTGMPELRALATKLGVNHENVASLKKQELIFAILKGHTDRSGQIYAHGCRVRTTSTSPRRRYACST
jgi:transcription termination factor Rho